MALVDKLKNTSKNIGSTVGKLTLAGIIAITPYIASVNKSYADEVRKDFYVELTEGNCPGGVYGDDCFDNVRQVVNKINNDYNIQCTPSGGNPNPDCLLTINVGSGTFNDSNPGNSLDVWYPTEIVGEGSENTFLEGFDYFRTPGSSSLSLKDLSTNNCQIQYNGSITDLASGRIENCSLTNSKISLIEGTDIQIINNYLENNGTKTGIPVMHLEDFPGSSNPVILAFSGNRVVNSGPAIIVDSGVNVECSGEGNTIENCDPYISFNGDSSFVSNGDFFVDSTKNDAVDVRGEFIKDVNGVRKMDAKEILDSYLNKDNFIPTGNVYLTRGELDLAGKIAGVNAGNVSTNNIRYVNPNALTDMAFPGYEGLTNLEHMVATKGMSGYENGIIGVNSAFNLPSYDGFRTFEDVDGDGVLNYDETGNIPPNNTEPSVEASYDPDVPNMMPTENDVPVSSALGLAALVGGIGAAGALAMKKKGKDSRK